MQLWSFELRKWLPWAPFRYVAACHPSEVTSQHIWTGHPRRCIACYEAETFGSRNSECAGKPAAIVIDVGRPIP
jgi:hypothetical protein